MTKRTAAQQRERAKWPRSSATAVAAAPAGSVAERGTVGGEPEAVTVDVRDGKQTLYVAAADRGILASDDQGRTFTPRYTE
ncbi:MAG: hypothetical protein ACR2K2_12740 [Mycobacteriales bacterium]